VAIIKAIKRATIIIVFAAATSLSAQDIAPEESTSAEGENPSEPTLAPEESTSAEGENPSEPTPTGPPIAPTNPDDGSLRAGVGRIAPIFYLGRRFRLSTSLTGGYDDNVNNTPTGSGSWYASPSAVFTYQFGNPRLAMDLIAGAGIIYYFDRPVPSSNLPSEVKSGSPVNPGGGNNEPNEYLRLSLVYKASERLTFDVSAFAAYQAQPDVTSALSANRRLGNFFRSEDNISAQYSLTPRFSTVTTYTFSAIVYQNSIASSGDRLENQLGEQVRYLLFPTTTATAGYRIGYSDYQTTGNNHLNQTLTAGLDQTFGPRLTGTFQGGLQLRSGQTSPYFDVGLHYSFRSATVSWTNRYSIEESGTGAGSGRETFRTNLFLNYRFTARISANLAVSYQNGTGAQGADTGFNGGVAGRAENLLDVSAGVRYAITPSLAVNAGYRYTESDQGSRSAIASQGLGYTRNRYFAGLTYTF
jgi:opacity protein-like surface antigen